MRIFPGFATRFSGFTQIIALSCSIFLCALTSCALTSCALSLPRSGKPVVLTTFTVLADIAKNIAGDALEVRSLTKIGAEIHGYEPTPSDIKKIAKADLVIENGFHLDDRFKKFTNEVGVNRLTAAEKVVPIAIEGDNDKPNPHAWMSPKNAQLYVDAMVVAFSHLAPRHRTEFTANANRYKAELQKISDELITRMQTLPINQRVLVTCEGAFSYLARDAGLTEKYLWAVNSEQQSAPKEIASAINFVRDNNIPAVFCESTVSKSAMQQVISGTSTKFGGTLYVDSLSAPTGPVPTYLALLRYDLNLIADGLTGA